MLFNKYVNNRFMVRLFILSLTCGMLYNSDISNARAVVLNHKNIKVNIGKTQKIMLKGANKKQLKKAKWSVKSGKKHIKIKISKSKASIKVTGKKTGKAKVLCKVAGKKLICKITVKAVKNKQNKPAVTATTPVNKATPVPVATLAPTPQATIMPVESERPTHIPTEDKLMAEPAKCTELPIMDEQGLPVPHPGGETSYYFYGSDILRSEIEVLRFSSSIDNDVKCLRKIDVSEKQNKSVIAWITDDNNNNYYEVTIAQEGGVVANEDSSYFCCGLQNVEGLENLYTENVRNLTRAFYQYIPCNSWGNPYLDLGDNFDTKNVEIFDEIFGKAGSTGLTVKLRLGKKFNVDKEKSSMPAFDQSSGWNMLSQVIAPNETVAKWARTNEPYCEVVVE